MFTSTGLAALIAIAALLAGCGARGESTGSTALTQTQFAKQAIAICEETRQRRSDAISDFDKQLAAEGRSPQGKTPLEEKLDTLVLPSMRSQLNRLEALEPPTGKAAQWSKLLSGLAIGIDRLEREGVKGLIKAPQLVRFGEDAGRLGVGRCLA